MNQAPPAEWARLEAQDPSGKLKKLVFERSIKMFSNGSVEKDFLLET